MNLSILIHSFAKYSFLWEGLYKHWQNNWRPIYPVTYFGTDIPCENDAIFHNDKNFQVNYSGTGEWSDRLVKLLIQIPADYILYIQEDHWPISPPPNIIEMIQLVEKHDLFRLQLSPVIQFYSLYGDSIPLFFHDTSKYLVSHQPSIWKKSFLLECLKPNETPWQNEYAGTMRLNVDKRVRGKIAIYPCNWYAHKCIKGKLVP